MYYCWEPILAFKHWGDKFKLQIILTVLNQSKAILFNTAKLALLGIVFLLGACSEDFPLEDQLRQTIKNMELSAEQRQISDLMSNVSEQYSDNQGRGKNEIKRIAQLYMLQNKNLHILRHITQLQIDEERAEAIVLVAVSGQPIDSIESLENIRAELMKFKLNFSFNEQWQLRSATWNRAGISDFL